MMASDISRKLVSDCDNNFLESIKYETTDYVSPDLLSLNQELYKPLSSSRNSSSWDTYNLLPL